MRILLLACAVFSVAGCIARENQSEPVVAEPQVAQMAEHENDEFVSANIIYVNTLLDEPASAAERAKVRDMLASLCESREHLRELSAQPLSPSERGSHAGRICDDLARR